MQCRIKVLEALTHILNVLKWPERKLVLSSDDIPFLAWKNLFFLLCFYHYFAMIFGWP